MVYMFKDNQIIDSAQLDTNDKFLIAVDSLKEGIYWFMHGPEMQYLFLEPGDSLLARLNTKGFDESLVFSGKGAERNNFLVNTFLINEKDDQKFLGFHKLADSIFEKEIDSTLQVKMNLYEQFKQEVPAASPLFDKVALTAIKYPLYRQKEAYPYLHRKALRSDEYLHTDPSFYKYRKSIDLNDKELAYYYAYRDYVREYLNHLAYEKQLVDDFKSPFNINFMKEVVDKIHIDDIKNSFLYETTLYTLIDDNSSDETKEKTKAIFFENCTNDKFRNEIALLIKTSEELPVGIKFPDTQLITFDNEPIDLNSIIKGNNVVIYTWPTGLRQLEYFAKRVKYLEKTYPEYKFIGINEKNPEGKWRNFIVEQKLNPKNQFRIGSKADWANVNFSRTILIDNQGIIRNNLTHLSSDKFVYQLKKLNNQ